jgi:hypothetical protein
MKEARKKKRGTTILEKNAVNEMASKRGEASGDGGFVVDML